MSLSDTALRTLAPMRRAEEELMGDASEQLLDRIEAEELMSLLAELSDRERQVLRWRFGLDGPELGPREIGERLGLCERRAREIERRARNKLRAAARGAGDGDGGGWAA